MDYIINSFCLHEPATGSSYQGIVKTVRTGRIAWSHAEWAFPQAPDFTTT